MTINSKLLLVLFIFCMSNLQPQTTVATKKYIEVTGSAEKYVTPDEIELEIVITEYTKDGLVIKLEAIERDFYETIRKNNISNQDLKLNNLESNFWWYWWNNRNKPIKTKTFKLSINSDINFLKLTEDLNKKWVESIRITDKKNKNLQNYRREVKIAAIKAAKEKAGYLLESIDEHVGGVISVEEVPDEASINSFRGNLLFSNTTIQGSGNSSEVENVSAIKIRYEIKVRFEIK